MRPPMWAHWRHLANVIELVLPSAQPSPQPKQQIDRFSHFFCTAHGRKSPYFTMGDPFPLNCAFSWGRSGRQLTHDSLGHFDLSPQSKRHHDRFSRFRTGDRRVSLYFIMGRPFPEFASSHEDLDPHLRHDSLGPAESTNQMYYHGDL